MNKYTIGQKIELKSFDSAFKAGLKSKLVHEKPRMVQGIKRDKWKVLKQNKGEIVQIFESDFSTVYLCIFQKGLPAYWIPEFAILED